MIEVVPQGWCSTHFTVSSEKLLGDQHIANNTVTDSFSFYLY